MNTKMCRKCGIVKSVTEFHKRVGKQDNYHSYCKKCAIEGSKKAYRDLNQKEWMEEQARNTAIALLKIIDLIREKYGCIVCGEKCVFCLDFHHINPKTKIKAVSSIASTKNITKTIIEINKCVVLCANCHRKFHSDILQFNETKICCEDLEYWKKLYKEYKKDIIKKKRPPRKLQKNKICECGKLIWSNSKVCKKCFNSKYLAHKRKVENRPSLEQLQNDVKELGYCGTGRKYGVTDNAIRKWIKSYGLS